MGEIVLICTSSSSAFCCNARSRRSGEQCRKAAIKGKTVCFAHGPASTGPRTSAGKVKCAEAKTVHCHQTRKVCAATLQELREPQQFLKTLSIDREWQSRDQLNAGRSSRMVYRGLRSNLCDVRVYPSGGVFAIATNWSQVVDGSNACGCSLCFQGLRALLLPHCF